MIEPTEADIGRAVIYRSRFEPRSEAQRGTVMAFNDYAVFVAYGKGVTPQATFREDLEWEKNDG